MKKNFLYKSILALTAFSLFFASCEVGLGESVDVIAPTVRFVSPEGNGTVPRQFTVQGKASDNDGIETLTFSIVESDSPNAIPRQFKWEGIWKELKDNVWTPCDANVATWIGDTKSATWEIVLTMDDGQSGKEYTLESTVTDKLKNESKDSKAEISVVLDLEDPNATVISPILEKRVYNSGDYNNPGIKESFEKSYFVLNNGIPATPLTPDRSVLTDSTRKKMLQNGDFEISGQIEEDTRVGWTVLYIDEGTSLVVNKDDTKTFDESKVLIKKELKNEGREFKFDILESDFEKLEQADPSKKFLGDDSIPHLLRVVTLTKDNAGNEQFDVQGWFTYWDASDKPWTNFTLGDDQKASDITGQKSQVYPESALNGYCYDDDGLKSVTVSCYFYIDDNESKWELRKTDVYNLDSSKNPTYYSWQAKAIDERKFFKIVVDCVDIYGNKSETITKYFAVQDVNAPKFTLNTPSQDDVDAALGNENGNIGLAGSVTDDGEIASLQVLKLPNNISVDQITKYYDPQSDYWTGKFSEAKEIKLETEQVSEGVHSRTFNQTFNVFTDFNIDGSSNDKKSNALTLLFRVIDKGGAATIESRTFKGDIEAPTLKFTNIIVKYADGSEKENLSLLENGEAPVLKPFTRDRNNKITDKICFEGEWNDNSVAHWANDDNKIGKVKITLGASNIEQEVSDTKYESGKGTFKTKDITPQDSSSGTVKATLTDWGGNTAQVISNYYVNSTYPELARINSTNQDKAYKFGDTIIIVLEFNKKVSQSTTPPTLILDNGGVAEFDPTHPNNVNNNGKFSTKWYYKYVVDEKSEATKNLKVTKIALPSGVSDITSLWQDENGQTLTVTKNNQTATGENVKPNDVLASLTNLDVMRSIEIDKSGPQIAEVRSITAAGSYKEAQELYFIVDFNKDVTISQEDLGKIKLVLKLGDKAETITQESASKNGPSSILFKYTVKNGNDTGDEKYLSFSSFLLNNAQILDNAGNALSNTTPKELNFNDINLDTIDPEPPVISQELKDKNGTVIYGLNESFSIEYEQNAKEKVYSLDGGKSWVNYNGSSVPLTNNGEYNIYARQTDQAGNTSQLKEPITITVDKGNVLREITSDTTAGIHKQDEEIIINLKFRKPIKITQSRLKLNIKKKGQDNVPVYATDKVNKGKDGKGYVSTTSATNKVTYYYTIQPGDDCPTALEVEQIELIDVVNDRGDTIKGTITDEKDTNIEKFIPIKSATSDGADVLSKNKVIKVVTGNPRVEKTTLADTVLKIKFDSIVSKSSDKTITIRQTDAFIAPAVLTKSQYDSYPSSIQAYYLAGTNGSDSKGNPNLEEKYILKYETECTDPTLCALFTSDDVKANVVEIPVGAVAVDVVKGESGVKDTLEIDMSDAYKLPVKGSSYSISIPKGVVINEINNDNDEKTDTFVDTQVELPTIRIKKENERITNIRNNTMTVEQPNTAEVKFDCQTPGAKIWYVSKGTVYDKQTISREYLPSNAAPKKMPQGASPVIPKWENEKEYNRATPLVIGSTNKNDYLKGYKYVIIAKAKKDSTYSEASYEVANKTVISIIDDNPTINNTTGDNRYDVTPSKYPNLWIRGGNSVSGDVTIPGYPFSWDKTEYTKFRAMTKIDNKTWYFASWGLTATTYFQFFVGNAPENTTTDVANGPREWIASSCGWVPFLDYYPAYPGESRQMDADGEGGYDAIYNSNRGAYCYQGKHYGSRIGKTLEKD